MTVNSAFSQVQAGLNQYKRKDNDPRSKFGRNLDRPYKKPRLVKNPKFGKDSTEPNPRFGEPGQPKFLPEPEMVYHPLDMMRMGGGVDNEGRARPAFPKQSNGAIGDVSTFQGGGCTSKAPTMIIGLDRSKDNFKTYRTVEIVHEKLGKTSKGEDREAGRLVRRGLPGKVRNPKARKRAGRDLDAEKHYDSNVKRQFCKLRSELLYAKWLRERLMLEPLDPAAIVILNKVDSHLRMNYPIVAAEFNKRDTSAFQELCGQIKSGRINRQMVLDRKEYTPGQVDAMERQDKANKKISIQKVKERREINANMPRSPIHRMKERLESAAKTLSMFDRSIAFTTKVVPTYKPNTTGLNTGEFNMKKPTYTFAKFQEIVTPTSSFVRILDSMRWTTSGDHLIVKFWRPARMPVMHPFVQFEKEKVYGIKKPLDYLGVSINYSYPINADWKELFNASSFTQSDKAVA